MNTKVYILVHTNISMMRRTITFLLEEEQYTKFKIYCIENKTTVTNFLKDKIDKVIN